MYRFYLNNITNNDRHYSELAREFLDDSEFETIMIDLPADRAASIALSDNSYLLNADRTGDRDAVKRELYGILSEITGREEGWGTLTGVRPLKPAMNLYHQVGSVEAAKAAMKEKYLIGDEKWDLLEEILRYQLENVPAPTPDKVALYTGVPFCPTKCSYCAFGSDVAGDQAIEEYLPCLYREVEYTGKLFRSVPETIESVYYGGGTPTTLSAAQLTELFDRTEEAFGIRFADIETTVEAGRPDTIDPARLEAIRNAGVSRISINPQSMNDHTLELIGRSHGSRDIEEAFRLADQYGFDVINSDIIAGLPEEGVADVEDTLRRVIDCGANNITVHTLSVKRGSILRDEDPDYYRRGTAEVMKMLETAGSILRKEGFVPYYIYRQKHQMGALENVGWCRPGKHSLYNIRIMEEKQTIIGLGAGAIGKRYYAEEDRLIRIPNINDHRMYKARIDEMIERKNKYFGG